MIIRKMTKEDIPEVWALDAVSFNKPWSEAMFSDEINKDYSDYFVAVNNDKIIGYGGIWSIYETAELMRIAVLPENRGEGIAKAILTEMTECAVARGCERMMLEVRAGNAAAQGLYKYCGFTEISVRRGYYDGEDAVIMERIFE